VTARRAVLDGPDREESQPGMTGDTKGSRAINETVSWQALVPAVTWQELRPASQGTAGPPGAGPPGAEPSGDGRDSTVGVQREALLSAGFVEFAARALAESKPLTIAINDAHRFTDTRSFLGAVFSILDDQGSEGLRLRVLVATGSHRSEAPERLAHEEAQLGPWRDRFEEIAWHDAIDAEGLCRVGQTEVNRWMGEQGFYLACGSMEPHYFAGVTGAHKTLTVGVMALACLQQNHSGAMSPAAAPLRLDNNPIHLGIVAALADLEDSGARLLALNQVLAEGKLVAVTAGHPLEALSRGLDAVRAAFCAAVDEVADVVVAEVGAPLNRDFYQADKGVKNTEAVVRDGGVLIVEAACDAGLGISHFVELLAQAPSHRDALRVVESRGYRLGDHKAVRLRALTDRRRVSLIVVARGLDPSLAEVLGAQIYATREQAIAAVGAGLSGRGLIVKDAGNMALEILDQRFRGD
jgi:nickel-dependent lactate racemase